MENIKTCGTCKIEKDLVEFTKSTRGKYGLNSECKPCRKIKAQKYYLDKKDYFKKYRLDNKERISIKQKEYIEKNKDKLEQYHKQYRLDNKERISIKQKEYQLDNKDKLEQYRLDNKEKQAEYQRNRKQTDILFKLKGNIRTLIGTQMKRQGYRKNCKTHKILGCDFETFKAHLEKQFTKGMSWENQGEWHLDHIYPVSLARDEAHLIELNHYTNFQPLWAKDNLSKGNKVLDELQLKIPI